MKLFSRILSSLKYRFCVTIQKRVPFTYEKVVSGWRIKGAGLPHFSSRLYRETKLLNKAIGSYHAKKSLEIGCGYGRLTPWIAEHSDKHYAIEPEPLLLKDAKKLYPSIYFYQAKAQKLPFANSYFDLCVSWTVLQHILPKELTKAVNEIKRVWTPEAIIILAEGVGKQRGGEYWEHTIEEWIDLFSPWRLTWYTEWNIGKKLKGGLVMRFEKSSSMDSVAKEVENQNSRFFKEIC